MSKASALGAALYINESTFGQDATPTIRMPIIDPVDLSNFSHEKLAPNRTVQYLQDDTDHITGPQEGTFRTRFYLTGHGSATSGSTSLTSLATLLQYVFGAAAVSAASGTTFTGGTATTPITVASATFSAGSLCRAGVFGDGRGGGQFHAVQTHSTTNLILLTGMAVAPTNGDVCHSAELISVLELPASLSAVTGISWRLFTANLQVDAHGCYASNITLTLPVNGGLPIIEIEWRASWWEFISETFPNAASQEEFMPAPAGPSGSVFLQTFGTATRATRTTTAFTVSIATNIVPVDAPGGVGQYQKCVGARRNPMEITVEWEEEAPSASTTPQSDTDWDEKKHLLYTLNSVAGRAVGVYFPCLRPIANRPTQNSTDGQNRQMRRYKATTAASRVTDLTAAAIKIALA
jgi:hypothetical protein